MDRIRYPKPPKKLFNQTTLFELLTPRMYRSCFIGSDAVDWILKHSKNMVEFQITSRAEASEFLNSLLESHVFHHVTYVKTFVDSYALYRFSVRLFVVLTNFRMTIPFAY